MTQFNHDKIFSYFVKKRKPEFDENTKRLSFTLNPFFTNFIAVQGGVRGKLHQELHLRTSIENLLSNPALQNHLPNQMKSIPATLLVLGGDCGTLEHIALSLTHGIPVLLCQGSGGVTDVLVEALRMTASQFGLLEYQKFVIIKKLRDLINLPVEEGHLFAADYMDAVTQIRHVKTCIKHRRMITIYRLDKPIVGAKLDQCILKALLSGQAASQYDAVALGVKWGKCEQIIQDRLLKEGKIKYDYNLQVSHL